MEGGLLLCRGAVSVFYSPQPTGQNTIGKPLIKKTRYKNWDTYQKRDIPITFLILSFERNTVLRKLLRSLEQESHHWRTLVKYNSGLYTVDLKYRLSIGSYSMTNYSNISPHLLYYIKQFLFSLVLSRINPWCSRYRRRKWRRRHEFKSWTRLIAFHIALIPLGKVWIQLFSLQLWADSRTD